MRHYDKCDLCVGNQITLLQINEDEWRRKKQIVQSIIKSKLGAIETLYARKCKIVKLTTDDYRDFININHLQGYKTASIRYGLHYNGTLVATMSFSRHHEHGWEINRFANKLNIAVIGGAGKLLSSFYDNIKPKTILSYADRRYSNGDLYRTLGFKLLTTTKPNYCYVKNGIVYSRQQFQKHKLCGKLPLFDPYLTEAENMFNNGYRRLWDAGHYKFLKKS